MKKVISALLSAAMLVSAFSACSSTSNAESGSSESSKSESSSSSESQESSQEVEETKDPVVVSVLFPDSSTTPYSEDWLVFDMINQYSGGTYDVISVPLADFVTKKNLLMNTGDIPDVLTRSFASPEQAFSGLILPIDELEAEMPIYSQWIEDYNLREELDRTRFADGHYYTVPVSTTGVTVRSQGWAIREDIFAENGLEVPKTLDDLYNIGLQLKEIYPDSTPLANRNGANNLICGFAGAFGTMSTHSVENGMMYDDETGEWRYAHSSDQTRDMLQYMNKLYESGVLDQEFATLSGDAYESKVVQGGSLILFEYFGSIYTLNRDGAVEDEDFHIVPIEPLSGLEGYEDYYALHWGVPWNNGWNISSKIKERDDYEEVLAFLDWFYTDEAELRCSFGTDDDYYEENGFLIEKDLDAINGLGDGHLLARVHPDLAYAGWGDEAPLLKAVYDFNEENDAVPQTPPKSPLTIEETEYYKVTVTNLLDYAKQMAESFIYGNESFDNWDAYVEGCNTKGATDFVDSYNTAWKSLHE